jgi:uncharacterized protein (DUF2147 family)
MSFRQLHNTRVILACLIIAALPFAAFSQTPNDVAGHWRTADRSAIVEITRCAQTICARRVWLRDNANARDERNPDSTKRGQRVCGIDLFSGFRPQSGGIWSSGSIYDPQTGTTISNVEVRLRRNELLLSVGFGVFAGSEAWQSVAPPLQPCSQRPNVQGQNK